MSPLSGRDSPPANEASEDTDEAMPVPEDLSATSGLQQNNRQGDKGLGEFGHVSQYTAQLPTVPSYL